ncbi:MULTISPECIES: APC family permease [Streptomyces]|uniref:APC family permease n=1 Tax=Streptomyces TaxID=1883 RepID=UPI00341ECF3C
MTDSPHTTAAPPQPLRGNLGTGDIAFFVVSAAAPLTVMAGIAPFAIMSGGIGAPAAYLFAGVALAIFSIGFTTMARHVDAGGAFYAYITRGMGARTGIASACLALFAYNALQIGLYGLFATATQATVHAFLGVNIPWPVYAFAAIALVALAGYRNIDFGAKLLGVLLFAETGILALTDAAVVVQGGAHGLELSSFAPTHAISPGTGILLAFAFGAFIGFESTAIYRSEARDPQRTVPRATYIAVGFLAFFYAFTCWTIIEAVGVPHAVQIIAKDPTSVVFNVTGQYVGGWAANTMYVLIISSVFAALLAFHNAINRYTFSLAREGILPARLSRTHPKHCSPHTAGVVQTALAMVVVAAFAIAHADPYRQLLIWVNTPGVIGIVLLQALTALAVPLYFQRTAHNEGVVRTVVAPAVSAVLMAGALYLMISKIVLLTGASATVNNVLMGCVPAVLVAGYAVAAVVRSKRREAYDSLAQPHEAPAAS